MHVVLGVGCGLCRDSVRYTYRALEQSAMMTGTLRDAGTVRAVPYSLDTFVQGINDSKIQARSAALAQPQVLALPVPWPGASLAARWETRAPRATAKAVERSFMAAPEALLASWTKKEMTS